MIFLFSLAWAGYCILYEMFPRYPFFCWGRGIVFRCPCGIPFVSGGGETYFDGPSVSLLPLGVGIVFGNSCSIPFSVRKGGHLT